MRRAVFSGFLSVIILALAVCSAAFYYFIGEYMLDRTQQDMTYSVSLIDYSLDYHSDLQKQIDRLNPMILGSASRITIIDKNGNVLADTSSYINYDDNHSGRSEVIAALKYGRSVNKRYSSTLHRSLLYVAGYSQKGNCIVRLAVPYSGLGAFAMAIIPSLLVSIVIAFLCAFFAAKRLSANITRPLDEISAELLKIQNSGQLISFKRYKYDELNNIARSTEILSERIENQMQLLKAENTKLDNILYNMTEGLVLIDNKQEVVIINKAAAHILDCADAQKGKNILHYTQDLKIAEGVSKVFSKGEESYFDLEAKGKIYVVHITKVTTGAIIIFIDVTYERESQSIRQNFFSDASHELKTPITSINGYAELLTSGIHYDEAQKAEFLRRIKNEAQNMTGLINDILMISRMETDEKRADRDKMGYVKINSVIDDILDTVEPIRKENNISIKCDCRDISIKADYNHLYQLINNIVVNAIKYNKPNGSVFISSKAAGNNYELVVKDTGIGIPEEYQKRVFERFFRVDKGRSKKMGGTGLGLAIVKHITALYKGTAHIKSRINEGTEIAVTLPLE